MRLKDQPWVESCMQSERVCESAERSRPRGGPRSPTSQRKARRSALSSGPLSSRLALLAALALAAAPASALTQDDITPLYFQPGGAQGFDPTDVAAIGRTPNLAASFTDLFLGAGGPSSGAPVQITSQVVSEIHQLPANATPSDPAIVDSTWTVQNVSAGALAVPVLLFTTLDPLDTYPGDPLIGFDADLLDLLVYTPPSGPAIVYGALVLPDLAQGESVEILVRYVVGGPLEIQDATQVLAPLGLAVAVTYAPVPEPSTLALCALGLAGIAAFSRKRPVVALGGGGRSMESTGCPPARIP
jgi:hypothetical protein